MSLTNGTGIILQLSFKDKLLAVRLLLKYIAHFTSKYLTGSIYSYAYISAGD